MAQKREVTKADSLPQWFYYGSIITAFMFAMYLSIYATIHFDDIIYMNIMVVFMFITVVSFYLISAIYFRTEHEGYHAIAPIVFFAGLTGLVFYAFKAPDTTDLVRYALIYAIIVTGVSLFILLPNNHYTFKVVMVGENKKRKSR